MENIIKNLDKKIKSIFIIEKDSDILVTLFSFYLLSLPDFSMENPDSLNVFARPSIV